MAGWGGGYVTDIEYGDAFFPIQTPRAMALAALFNGYEPPDLDGPFTYCELGCGRGATSLVIAAVHPQAVVHGVDFHPGHVAHARARAKAAGLTNVHFHEVSFDALLTPDAPALPKFDMITLHGVWSWIAPGLQDAIVDFIDARLSPGGMVYVSYNALPGWTQVAPLQRLVRALAEEHPGRSDRAAQQAFRTLARMSEIGLIPERLSDGVKRMIKVLNDQQPSYLAHEFLNEHWAPQFHMEVAGALSRAKLSFVADAELMRSFHNLRLTEVQREAVGQIASPELRETLRDMASDVWFREDLFQRGPRRITHERREAMLRALTLTPVRRLPEALEVDRADGGVWRPEPAVYEPVLQVLQSGPARVGDLLTMPGLPAGHLVSAVELVGILVGCGLAAPIWPVSSEARAAGARWNDLVGDAGDGRLTDSAAVAAPALAGGLSLSPIDLMVFNALRRGEEATPAMLARRFVDMCRAAGGHPIIEGRPVEDEAEAIAALSADYEARLQRIAPLWRMMGVLDR